ncbi:MAG: peptidoglycan DD-metalloendopeptidase family protein [Tepidiformaceae bacterium]
MGIEGKRARSTAHGKRHGRITVHILIVALAVAAVSFAARFPNSSSASTVGLSVPAFSLSGLTGTTDSTTANYFATSNGNATHDSVAVLTAPSDVMTLRAAGGVSPTASFSGSVTAAAATSGQQGAGVKPLADFVDPQQPFILYTTQPGDSVSGVSAKFGIEQSTLLMNNTEVSDKNLIQNGQQLIIPRKDGILYKIKAGDTVATIVGQYDNITADTVVGYKPNAIADPNALPQGVMLLLPGATVKPPPPPPPPPPPKAAAPNVSSGSDGGSGGTPYPGANGRFHYPLAHWQGVSDPFGVDPAMNRFHTGIDLDLYSYHHSSVFSACDGVVTTTEYLTYSYGYHVIVDCGDGFSTLYAHLSEIDVAVGQHVSAGTQVGVSGVTGFTTGEHLHFEIRVNGTPVDPQNYLDFGPLEPGA